MSIKLKTIVDLDSEVDLPSLPPKERLYTALRYSLGKSSIVKNMRRRKADSILKKRQEEIEVIKTVINARINAELIRGRTLKDTGEIPKAIRLVVPRYLKKTFEYCQKSGEFISYTVKILEEDKDVLRSNPDMPMIVEIAKELVIDGKDIISSDEEEEY